MLCEKCVVDKTISSFIIANGQQIQLCTVCGATNVYALSCDEHDFQCLFKAVVRYNFNEWQYNTHWGGERIETVLISSDAIFCKKAKEDALKIEGIIMSLTENVYEDYDSGISLHAGYSDGLQNTLLESISEGGSSAITSLIARAKSKNYYELESAAEKIINRVVTYVDNDHYDQQYLYRARIGYEKKLTPIDFTNKTPCYVPYKHEAIHAPLPYIAAKGRMNRENVSYLYLASSEETAISEVRPHPGHIVSLGTFEPKQELRLADFAAANILDFFKNDKLLDTYADIVAINRLFSIPVPPGFQYKYVATQLISDLIRQKGFDGISFVSSISGGVNFAFFNPSLFTYVEDSAKIVSVKGLTYSYSHTNICSHGNEDSYYDTDRW